MKNLDVFEVSTRNLGISSNEGLHVCYGHDESNSSGDLYVCTHNLNVTNFGDNGLEEWCVDLSEHASPDSKPVNVTYLSLLNTLCLGLSNGELLTVGENGSKYELAGLCDDGLLSMEWSPDQELVVLVTKNLNMILMSCTFDPITETNLLNEEFGEKQFITVGWGKKETQFHGREGKQARVKSDVVADSTSGFNNTIKITWRGDGSLYAVGFTIDNLRRFKVFDREGQLQYTSEKQQGLEANLSWRPSGNVIATTQKLDSKCDVAFFEKNGLKHGGFSLPVDNNTIVEDITWSSDSEILTLQCKDSIDNTQKLLLYTTGNYHWYLKQTLIFKEQSISKVFWDNDFNVANNKKLHVVFHKGLHYTYNWVWSIDHSKGCTDSDDAIVTVIDGNRLLVTGLRQTVVPPPMSALELKVDTFINSVHFAPANSKDVSSNTFFVCTADQKLIFYEQTQKFPLEYKSIKIINLEKYEYPFQYYNWFWMNNHTIVCIINDGHNGYSVIEHALESNDIRKRSVTVLPAAVTRIHSHPTDSSIIFLQLNNGEILQYNEGSIEPKDIMFDVACPKISVFFIEDELYFLGLSHKGHLYLNDGIIMNNVSSFFVHTHFLLLTTLQHLLLSAELTKLGITGIKEHQKNESAHVYKRKIERGAKLVIAVPKDTRTVFQMPRGNLEGIQPRPLSLKIIGEYLEALKYNEAFDLMRKQRINLNLIHDHDPDKFNNHINIFLESIMNNSWLSLFLSELENVDVTKTMYSSSYADKINNKKHDFNRKTERICNVIREQLQKRDDSETKILPLLTTFVKKNTIEDLEQALLLLKQLKIQESAGSKLPVGSDEALKYLLYMVEVNNLFDVALGMYDFDLVLLVANKSQKDPKEFIPMLNELNEMEENYKRFSINKHLKRFDRAVKCLVKCGPAKHEELKAFVKFHSLYKEALGLFSQHDDVFKQISDDYGLYLKLKKQYTEAGIVYERAHSYEKAVECYKDALEWELAINIAAAWPNEQFKALCRDLITELKEEKRHKEALTILEQFYEDREEAIQYAIETRNYKTAIRLSSQYDKKILRDERILPAVLEEYSNLCELVETNLINFIRYRDRLFVVRENKSKMADDMYDPSYNNRDSDLYSDAGSTLASSSRGSTRSFRSSKNRRKHERKVASLKEGSQYEDVALVMALHNLVTSSFEQRLPIKETNIALMYLGKDKEAFILQTSLEKLLKEMKDSFKDIWTSELVLEATNAFIAAQNVPEGCSVIPQGIGSLEPHLRIAPVVTELNWKLNGLD